MARTMPTAALPSTAAHFKIVHTGRASLCGLQSLKRLQVVNPQLTEKDTRVLQLQLQTSNVLKDYALQNSNEQACLL